MISIVIPTCNRTNLVRELIENLSKQTLTIEEIIIVDSSDEPLILEKEYAFTNIKLIHTKIKSAAKQRNIGIEIVNTSANYLVFLDDDVRLSEENYLESIIKTLGELNAVGCSGIAVGVGKNRIRNLPSGLVGLFHRFFLLDSIHDGKLLKSGVNIPVRNLDLGVVEVDWLIGCSVWRFETIQETRFEDDFLGASLAEDVIFSVRMKQKGKIVTDPNLKLLHLESKISRVNIEDFWSMWITNRFRLIQVASFGVLGILCFWWANLGQVLIFCIGLVRFQSSNLLSIKGIIKGIVKVQGKN